MIDVLNKIVSILDKREKRTLVLLSILLFIGMLLEIFGLSLIFPFIISILEPETLSSLSFIIIFREILPEIETSDFILLFLILLFLVYVVKTIVMVFIAYWQNKFLGELLATISTKLYSKYLNQPYEYHVNNNSSRLIKNIQVEVSLFRSLCLSLITSIIEVSIAISIFFTLLYIEPKGAVVVLLYFSIISIVYYSMAKNKLKRWGVIREKLAKRISKVLIEGLNTIREVLLLDIQEYYISKFEKLNQDQAIIFARNGTFKQLPRLMLELFAIIGIILFIFVLLLRGESNTIILSTIGVFVAATFRMIPSLNRTLTALQNVKFYSPSVDIIHEEFRQFNETKKDSDSIAIKPFIRELEFNNVSFAYSSSKQSVLNDTNLVIKKGEYIGIIGSSGSGKSTFIDLVAGLNKVTNGAILCDGDNINLDRSDWRNQLSYVSQNLSLIDDTISNNITLGIDEKDVDKVLLEKSVKNAGLSDFIDRLEEGLSTYIGERGLKLSGGQKQRIGIARALYRNTEILLLDEATSSLDNETERNIMDSINALKGEKTIIIVAHRLSTLVHCNKIYEIKNGKIIKSSLNV